VHQYASSIGGIFIIRRASLVPVTNRFVDLAAIKILQYSQLFDRQFAATDNDWMLLIKCLPRCYLRLMTISPKGFSKTASNYSAMFEPSLASRALRRSILRLSRHSLFGSGIRWSGAAGVHEYD
jgi:hypothetical protein